MNYFTSDLHFGHKNIVSKYRQEFSSIEEHDTLLLEQFSKLNKRDIVFVLGDFIFECKEYEYYINQLKKMPCRIKLLLGNHDSKRLYNEDRFELLLPLTNYKKFWLTHAPIHSQEMRYRLGNIHGHMHKEKLSDKRYFNVNVDMNEYKFIEFDRIREYFKGE